VARQISLVVALTRVIINLIILFLKLSEKRSGEGPLARKKLIALDTQKAGIIFFTYVHVQQFHLVEDFPMKLV
jgi:hypothetical protein